MTDASPTARRINWRQEYLHIAVILMTACWLAPWLALSLAYFLEIELSAALGLAVANLLASTLITRRMYHRRTDDGLQTTAILLWMWAAAAATVLVLPLLVKAYGGKDDLTLIDLFYIDRQQRVPGGPLVIAWVLFLWWRGFQLGSIYMTLVRASFGLRLGMLAFFWLFLFANPALRRAALPTVPVFFFLGLLSTSLARADSLNLDRSRTAIFGRGWIVSLLFTALGLTLAGYVAALWLSGMDMARAADIFKTIGEGALTLLLLVASPLLLLAQLIYNLLRSILPDQIPGDIFEIGSGDDSSSGGSDIPLLADIFAVLTDALIVALIVFLILLIIAFFWFLLIGRDRQERYSDEEREALGTAEVVGGLRQTLRAGWQRLADTLGLLRRFGLGSDLFAALTIRRIYARMEKLAGKRGYPRALSDTPYEYRRELVQAYPGMGDDVQTITEAYVAVRYGEIPEDQTVLQPVRAAWERLQNSSDPVQLEPFSTRS
ncbi:MAG: DUF4129 domain-containing protein [Anaerolineae bacterium]|nr:DUF4129 domain-containing protein [Anaerolineae bacterium]